MAVRARGIRPVTLGRRLVAAIDDFAAGSEGEIGGRYEVLLHPSDVEEFTDSITLLATELTGVVSRHATFEGYRLADEPEVRIRTDDDVPRGDCRIDRLTVVAARDSAPRATGSVAVHRGSSWRLVTDDGIRYPLEGEVVTVGRQASCSIPISSPNLSRLHAELRFTDGRWRIEDRGSTNGTRVNDELIVLPTVLEDGDLVYLGSVRLRIERAG